MTGPALSYDWNFSVLLDKSYIELLGRGFLTTLSLTFWCILAGTPLGVFLGSLPVFGRWAEEDRGLLFSKDDEISWRRAPARILRVAILLTNSLATVLIDGIRAIPLLLLMLTSYYSLPVLLGRPLDAYICVAVAMAVNLSAFIADLVRGAALAVPRGDILAARGLGMGRFLTLRRIILPEVFREILPGLSTLYITMLKMSTLASAVAVYEILHSADSVIQKTYRPLELYVMVCVAFLVVVLPLSMISRRLEQSRVFLRRS